MGEPTSPPPFVIYGWARASERTQVYGPESASRSVHAEFRRTRHHHPPPTPSLTHTLSLSLSLSGQCCTDPNLSVPVISRGIGKLGPFSALTPAIVANVFSSSDTLTTIVIDNRKRGCWLLSLSLSLYLPFKTRCLGHARLIISQSLTQTLRGLVFSSSSLFSPSVRNHPASLEARLPRFFPRERANSCAMSCPNFL
jgi:hypothetical protein